MHILRVTVELYELTAADAILYRAAEEAAKDAAAAGEEPPEFAIPDPYAVGELTWPDIAPTNRDGVRREKLHNAFEELLDGVEAKRLAAGGQRILPPPRELSHPELDAGATGFLSRVRDFLRDRA